MNIICPLIIIQMMILKLDLDLDVHAVMQMRTMILEEVNLEAVGREDLNKY